MSRRDASLLLDHPSEGLPASELLRRQCRRPARAQVVFHSPQPAANLPRQTHPGIDHHPGYPLLLVLAADAEFSASVNPVALVGRHALYEANERADAGTVILVE